MVENTELYQKYFDLVFKDSPVFEQKNWKRKYGEITAEFLPNDDSIPPNQISYFPEICDRPEVVAAGLQGPIIKVDRFYREDYRNTSPYGPTITDFISSQNRTSFLAFNWYYLDSQGRTTKLEEVRDSGDAKEMLGEEDLEETTVIDELLEESVRCVVLTTDDENYLKTLAKRIEDEEFELTSYFAERKGRKRIDEWTKHYHD